MKKRSAVSRSGLLLDPPPISAPVKAIVDVHEEKVVAIAPVSEFEKIAVAVMQLRKSRGSGRQTGRGEPGQGGTGGSLAVCSNLKWALPIAKPLEPNKAAETKKEGGAKNGSNSEEDFFGKLINNWTKQKKRRGGD